MKARLTNMPIAKNILFLAMQMNQSLENEKNLTITDDCEITYGVTNNPYPWLWSRTVRNKLNQTWSFYFNDWKQPDFQPDKMLRFTSCVDAIFKPKEEYFNKILTENKKNIGIHVRRGDAKYYLEDTLFKKVVDISKYVEIIRKNYDPKEYSVYCASDSIIETLQDLEKMLPEFEIIHSKKSELIPTIPMGQDLEIYLSSNEEYIEDVVVSAINDLYNLSKCDVFIGPYHDSVYSTVTALLCLNGSKEIINIVDGTNSIDLGVVKNIGIPL